MNKEDNREEKNNDVEQDPVQVVKQYIYKQMKLQQLNEGDRLPSEIALSQLLDIPRNNVRDALQSLKSIGLLNSVRGSGYVLSPNFDYSLAEVLHAMMSVSNISRKDINEVRLALEKKALELIVRNNISETELAGMERQVRIMEQHSNLGAREKINPRACVEADKEFHRQLSIVSGNTFIRAFNISLNQYYDGYVALQWERMNHAETEQLVNTHKNMVKHMRKHQLEKAGKDLDEHYMRAAELLQKLNGADQEELKEVQSLIINLQKKGFSLGQIQDKLRELEDIAK